MWFRLWLTYNIFTHENIFVYYLWFIFTTFLLYSKRLGRPRRKISGAQKSDKGKGKSSLMRCNQLYFVQRLLSDIKSTNTMEEVQRPRPAGNL